MESCTIFVDEFQPEFRDRNPPTRINVVTNATASSVDSTECGGDVLADQTVYDLSAILSTN
jgi:hypothetical protein